MTSDADLFAPCPDYTPPPWATYLELERCCNNCSDLDSPYGPACPEFNLRMAGIAGPIPERPPLPLEVIHYLMMDAPIPEPLEETE